MKAHCNYSDFKLSTGLALVALHACVPTVSHAMNKVKAGTDKISPLQLDLKSKTVDPVVCNDLTRRQCNDDRQ
jgi:hypothetical protein